MANLLEKGRNWLIKHEIIMNIREGYVDSLFFPKEMPKWLVTKRVDYIEMAIKQGYIIDISTPDYIKNNPKYVDLFLKIIRHRIKEENFCGLYNISAEILEKIGINYIKKAIDNGFDLTNESEFYNMSPLNVLLKNTAIIEYIIERNPQKIIILNKVHETVLQEICKNPKLMCNYIEMATEKNKKPYFIADLNIDYIMYYINRAKIIGDTLSDVSLEKWKQIYSINPDLMKIALAKGMRYDELPDDVIDIFESQLIEQGFNDIMNGKYLGYMPEILVNKIASNPEYTKAIIKNGQFDIFYYVEYTDEYLRLLIEEYLGENELREINEITRKNYKNYDELLSVNENFNRLFFEYIKDKLPTFEKNNYYDEDYDYEEAKERFKTTTNKFLKFLKITKINGVNIDYKTLMRINDELLSKYKTKVVTNLMQNEFFNTNQETRDAVFVIIGIFGLFDDDKIASNTRFNKINSALRKIPDKISEDEYKDLLEHFNEHNDLIKECFESVPVKKYTKKQNQTIPACLEIYSTYFTDELTEKQYKFLKKLLPKGTINRELTDYLRNTYEEEQCTNYMLKNNISQEKINEIINMMQQIDIEGMFNVESLHMIFSSCKQTYSEEFYEFIIDNIDKILVDKRNQRNIWEIQRNFDKIKEENVGQKVSYVQAIEYVNKVDYGNIKDTNFIQELKKAGVTSADAAKYYLELHQSASTIKATSLPCYEKEYIKTVNGEKVKFRARRLDKSDPLLVLVGEKEYTNCCQSYAQPGQRCNEHSAKSAEGGVFVTEVFLNDKWVLLTQSWDWVNNNVYCHDNIEATKIAKKYKDIIAEIYFDHAKYVIETSKKTIEQYITNNSLDAEKLKQAKRQIITLVTVGTTFNDINIFKYFKRAAKSPIGPVGYNGYRDSDFQRIIEGTEQFIESKSQSEQLHFYKEKTLIKKYKISQIWNTREKIIISEILSKNNQNIDDYYSEKTNVIYTDNWVIICTPEEEKIMINSIAILNESEETEIEILNELKKLSKIYPLMTTSEKVKSSKAYNTVILEQTQPAGMTNKIN